MQPLQFTSEDFKSPERLERLFQRLNYALAQYAAPTPVQPDLNALAMSVAPLIKAQLQAPGVAPLNLQSLLPATGEGAPIVDTHANRATATYDPDNYSVGQLYFESDRIVMYVVVLSSGVNIWRYAGGTYYAATASQPTDLGANDAGFRFVDSTADTQIEYFWSGTEWLTIDYLQEVIDGATNSITQVRVSRHLTTGLAAVGFGLRETFQLEDAAGQTEDAVSFDTDWTNATSGSETSRWAVRLRDAGAAMAIYFAALVTDIRFRVGGFFGIITHANTATRTYTLANATGNIPVLPTAASTETGTGAIVRTTSPTIVTPTIASFTNATHSHQNAAGGGTLDAAAIAAGTLAVARGGTGVGSFAASGIPFESAGALTSSTNLTYNGTDLISLGSLQFGAFTAIGAETVTGYITAKDAGGTSRKLAVVA